MSENQKRNIDTICLMCSEVYVVNDDKWIPYNTYKGNRQQLSHGICDNKVCELSYVNYALGNRPRLYEENRIK